MDSTRESLAVEDWREGGIGMRVRLCRDEAGERGRSVRCDRRLKGDGAQGEE